MGRYSYIIIFYLVFSSFYSSGLLAQKNSDKNLTKFKFLYSEALKFKTTENYLVAAQHFEECIKLIPESSASAYQLSLVYLILEEPDKALFYINYALKLNPENEWYIIQQISIAGIMGNAKLYESSYQFLHQNFPKNATYTYELALIYYKNQKYRNSLKLLQKLETDIGVAESISFLKNNIFLELKEYHNIENELQNLVNVFADSVKYIDMLGEYYFSMRKINKALNTYNLGIESFPDNKKLNIKLAKVYSSISEYLIGYDFLLKGIGANNLSGKIQFSIAKLFLNSDEIVNIKKIEIYRRFVYSSASSTYIENSFITFLLDEKEFSLAEKEIKNIFKTSFENFQLWNSLFSIYLAQNRFEELNSATEEAKLYFPNQANVYFYNGYSHFVLKNYNKANSSFLTGVDYVIDNQALKLDFYLYLAESFHALNNNNKSDFYFDQYLSIDSTNAYLLNNYAYYLSQRENQLQKAFKLSNKSIEIEPFNSSFLDTYSWIFYLTYDFKNALFYIEKAYKFGGNANAVICEHYGYILAASNRREEAITFWKESLKLNPNNKSLQTKLQSFN